MDQHSVHNSNFLEMSKAYKVHKYFDLDHLTLEEPCRCSSGSGTAGWTPWMFGDRTNVTQIQLETFNHYNTTMNGTIGSAGNIDWSKLTKSQCEL